jgi:quercetin dioxygenase-like cupin family protein
MPMSSLINSRFIWTLASSVLILGAASISTSGTASAGSCPADKVTTDGQKPVTTPNSNVTDTVIGSIDLKDEAPRLKEHKFRLRKLVVQPGGVVAWHSHGERPAIIYIVSGTITEYASSCAVPIVHTAGDVARETHTTAHWWKNKSKKPTVLLSADILHDKSDPNGM